MWNKVLGSGDGQGRFSSTYSAEDLDSPSSRRVSAASDDSFDASSYVHVDNKLNNKMPKCLLSCDTRENQLENRFTKTRPTLADSSVTKSGKRVIRKRLSISEFNASRLKANINNNSNSGSRKVRKNQGDVSSSSDNDTLPKSKKRSTDVLSAKIQHLLFEMKRLRQVDRDILRQFLIINDTIEEQKWVMEEKQQAIKRNLSEEGEDPVSLGFDGNQEIQEARADDEESIQSVLSRQNSNREVFSGTSSGKDSEVTKNDSNVIRKDADLGSTSSDSALSMTGGSSTLSSTTSLPVSNRSTSPSTSNLSTTSASSSYVDSMEAKMKANEIISTTRTEPIRRVEHEYEGDDIEGYYRMNGAAMKRGSYPFPRQSQSFDMCHSSRSHYDDNTLDSAYSTRRGSTDSDSRDAVEYGIAARIAANQYYDGSFHDNAYQGRPMPRSNSVREQHNSRNRVRRISVRPDGTVDNHTPHGLRRASSVNERTSVSQRLIQNPSTQRQLARLNINRQVASLSFVPIAEQEPDVMLDNGRIYSAGLNSPSKNTRSGSAFRQGHHQSMKVSQRTTRTHVTQQPQVSTSSSHRSSSASSTRSSNSSSSALSNSNYLINEAEHRRSRGNNSQEPVWIQRIPAPQVQVNNHYDARHNYQSLLAQSYAPNYHVNQGAGKFAGPFYGAIRNGCAKRTALNCPPAYRENSQNSRVLTVSCTPKSSEGSKQAVYQWIQTQDDVTYL